MVPHGRDADVAITTRPPPSRYADSIFAGLYTVGEHENVLDRGGHSPLMTITLKHELEHFDFPKKGCIVDAADTRSDGRGELTQEQHRIFQVVMVDSDGCTGRQNRHVLLWSTGSRWT